MSSETTIRNSPESPGRSSASPSSPRIVATVDIKALEYAGPIDANLLCPICQCPFLTPVRLQCDHIFCSDCLEDSIQIQQDRRSTCPACRRSIDLTASDSFQKVPRVINQIVDNLQVQCPSADRGCKEEVPRGTIHDHVRKYCPYTIVQCPADGCLLPVSRKDYAKGRCLHFRMECQDCTHSFWERDLEDHRSNHCRFVTRTCPHCDLGFLKHQFERHVQSCPEAVLRCEAATYGCDFTAKAQVMADHSKSCSLAKLVPFLKAQDDRLEAHEKALDALRAKNWSLETVLCGIAETMESFVSQQKAGQADPFRTASHLPEPYDSTTHHLLCGHESLRRDVERMSTEISNLDAKTSMMILNESHRAKNELAHANAAISSLRMQLNWLTSPNHQRGFPIRSHPPSESIQLDASIATSEPRRLPNLQPARRLSDDGRQEPKL